MWGYSQAITEYIASNAANKIAAFVIECYFIYTNSR